MAQEEQSMYFGPQLPAGHTYVVRRIRETSQELNGTTREVSGSVFDIARAFDTPQEFGTVGVEITHSDGEQLLPHLRRTVYFYPKNMIPMSDIIETRTHELFIETRTGGMRHFQPTTSGFVYLEGHNPYTPAVQAYGGSN